MLSSYFSAITSLYPFYKGRGRLALSSIHRSKDDFITLAKLKSGPIIYIYPNDYIGRMVYFFGDLDPKLTAFILNNIALGDVVVDVGANLGVITLAVASHLRGTGAVIAFEPVGKIANALEKSCEMNKFTNIKISRSALSDFEGETKMLVPEDSLGQSAISDKGQESVKVNKLDNIDFAPIRSVRILKMDVEGHETKVLAGGLNFIKNFLVDLVIFESHPRNENFNLRPEVVLLRSIGYGIYELNHRAFWGYKTIKIADGDKKHTPKGYDFIALRPGAERIKL
jgi:FkbM family methyltransferase